MDRINYDGRKFRVVQKASGGEVGRETIFHYHQSGDIVCAEYAGGEIRMGHLIAIADSAGRLDMRYHHVNSTGELMTGVCRSTPEVLADGRVRLFEKWHWTCGNRSSGESVLVEFPNLV